MSRCFASIVWLAFFMSGCGGDHRTLIPTAPSQPVPPPAPFSFSEPYSQITIGEVVVGRVAADDPRCDQWQCQYFRITAPTDGSLEVALTYSGGNLDVFLNDLRGSQWWDPHPVRGKVRVSLPAKAGATYQIGVLEYERPGIEFELVTTLQPV
jgi:hypothetical protein